VVSKQERSTEEGIVTERGQMQNTTEKGGGVWGGGGGLKVWGGWQLQAKGGGMCLQEGRLCRGFCNLAQGLLQV